MVTSDRPVQMAALGDGAGRLSARELHDMVASASGEILREIDKYRVYHNRPFEKVFTEPDEE